MTVEFRFLTYEFAPIARGQVPVGLIHWDQHLLRVAWSTYNVPTTWDVDEGRSIEAIAKDIMRAAAKRAQSLQERPPLRLPLRDLFPVQQGMNAALRWGPVLQAVTEEPALHFEAVRKGAALRQHNDLWEAVGTIGLPRLLESVGAEFSATDRVRIHAPIDGGQVPYAPPVSWKNALWHHGLPLNLRWHGQKAIMQVLGTVQNAIPEGQGAVVVVEVPAKVEAKEAIMPVLYQAKRVLDRYNTRFIEDVDTHQLREKLREMMREDLSAVH